VRLAVEDKEDARAIKEIKRFCLMPIVADIHFDWRLAILAIESGVDKIRLNPGNISKQDEIIEVARAAKINRIPIRVGANSGSIQGAHLIAGRNKRQANILVAGVLDYIKILEKRSFYDIVISLKASNILDTVRAYRQISKILDYPLHLGLTATGPSPKGIIKSSIAIGSLLLDGIGDTIRVSLTDNPEEEIRSARGILEPLGLLKNGPDIVSCPTCGRCKVDLVKIVKELDNLLSAISFQPSAGTIRVAVMGCVVNGPGEAKDADIGVAFGKKDGLLFRKGRAVRKIPASKCVSELMREITRLAK
ncbi:MAG: flavodoxin-dependent (E)-4-hydroxy-3-methylbut-2-enyl-diphosphate synthase, partial [Candidatus Omnitrophica bacterium]|nr:flavodoxin-dependent (E)-4-hydroxy-3-methylbut-2-enyl-diphosphate synthase [Candidatus Omnitrophota bacterium]